MLIKRWVGEFSDSLRDVMARGLDGNVIVVGKVDTSVGSLIRGSEELTLSLLVCRTWDVLTILPATVTRALGSATATTVVTTSAGVSSTSGISTTWSTIGIRVEGARTAVASPTIGLGRRPVGSRRRTEFGSTTPAAAVGIVGCPSATIQASTGTSGSRTSAVHVVHWGSGGTVTEVRRNVRRTSIRTHAVGSMSRVLEGETIHIEVISHTVEVVLILSGESQSSLFNLRFAVFQAEIRSGWDFGAGGRVHVQLWVIRI